MGIDDIYYSGTSYGSSTSSIGVGGGEVLNVSGIVNNVSIYQGMQFTYGGSYQLTYGSVNVLSGGTAFDVYANGRLAVKNGGKVYSAYINKGGRLSVSNGGIASSVYVDDSGSYNSYGGYVPDVAGAYISSGGIVSNAFVKKQGHLHVSSSGRLVSATVSSGGTLCIHNGGILADTTVSDGGYIIIESNASLAGKLNLKTNNCIISSGAVINFLLNENQSKETPYIFKYSNTGSNISSANFTITIGPDQSAGTYTLIEGVSAFSQSITVKNTAGSTLGTVSVGNNVSYGGYTYKLANNNAKMLFTISSTPVITDTIVPTLNGEPTVSVNGQNVAITWSAASDNVGVAGYQIKIGNNTYSTSGTSYSLSSLAEGTYTYQVRAYDAAGNYSDWSEAKDFQIQSDVLLPVTGDAVKTYSGTTLVSSADVMTGKILVSGGTENIMRVSNSGMADSTTVNSGGTMYVSSGGKVSNTFVSGGYMYVYNGGRANDTTVDYRYMHVSSGGIANNTRINLGGWLIISSGGTAGNTVNDDGVMIVSSRGVANSTTVNSGGWLEVSSGGTATEIVENGGCIYVLNGADVTFTPNTFSGLILNHGTATVHSGTTAVNTMINSMGELRVFSGGTANSTMVNSDGWMFVYSGGTVNEATVNSGGRLNVYSGGIVNAPSINPGGRLVISSGGTAALFYDPWQREIDSSAGAVVTYLDPDARIYYGNYKSGILSKYDSLGDFEITSGNSVIICSDGIANNTTVKSYGHLYVSSGGTANNTTVNVGGSLFVHSGGTANSISVNYNGDLTVFSGGIANNTAVNGSMDTWGTVNSTTVNSTGSMYVASGTANNTTVNVGGSMSVYSGGTAMEIVENGGYVFIAAGANVSFIPNSFSGLVLNYRSATVHSGTTANNTTVNGNCGMFVYSGGMANNTIVNGGNLVAYSGGKHTGTLQIAGGATVSAYSGSIIDFTVAGRTAEASYLINNLALISGSPTYTITLADDQAEGVYKLAQGASAFTGTLSIGTETTAYGRLTVNGNALKYADQTFTLATSGDSLLLTVAEGNNISLPSVLSTSANVTTPTNQNVIVSATFSGDSAQKQYSTDNRSWKVYTAGIVLNANGTVYFRGIDAAGNISEVASYTVTNIDKVAPAKPTVSASTTKATNQNVTVSATFSADSSQKQYSLDNNDWQAYTTGVVMSANGTVWFRGIDAAGNISDVTPFTVSNIDKVAPTKPTATASTTMPTNQNVTVSGTFSNDTVTKQYSRDNSTWQTYTSGIVMSANGTLYFRGIDAVGNVSKVTSYAVTNIDKVAPTKPTAAANTTAPTNQNVTVTAIFSGDSAQKQYSYDNKNWQAYTSGIVMTANGTVYFRGIDTAGNISEVTSYAVTNIDKTAPVAPTASANITEKTRQNVMVTANFSADSARKQYSLDNANWNAYTSGIVFAENGTVWFRGIDTAGNISGITAYTVGNIQTNDFEISGNQSDNQNVPLNNPGKYTLAGDFGDITGTVTIFNGGKKAGSGTIKKGVLTFNNGNPVLLDSALETVIQVTVKTGTDTNYTATLEAETVFDKGDTDSRENPRQFGNVTAPGTLVSDGWVGFGDEVDYLAFSLDHAANLCLDLTATDAAKFTLYDVNKKSVMTSNLKAGTALSTKPKLLEAGTYYLEVQSTNAKKGGDADYTVALNDKSVFFTKGNNEDDAWNLAGDLGAVTTESADYLTADWVGFGDEVDYGKFTLESGAQLSFTVNATDAAKFTVWQLQSNGKLKSLQSTQLKAGQTVNTKELLLSTGDYYFSMQSTNAKKGGNADYGVAVNAGSVFFPAGDNSNDTWKAAVGQEAVLEGEEITGWVGFGNASDFIKFELAGNGQIQLDLNDAAAEAYKSKQIKLTCLDAKGKSVALGVLDSDTLVSKKPVATGEYYLGVSCANVQKFNTSYSVTTGLLTTA